MMTLEELGSEAGVFSDIRTRNVIFREHALDTVVYFDGYTMPPGIVWKNGWSSPDENVVGGSEIKSSQKSRGAIDKKITGRLEDKIAPEPFSAEYFAQIRDEKERREAYTGMQVSGAISQDEADLARDPFKFLGLAPSAKFSQVRIAYQALASYWHPDRMIATHPFVEQILGKKTEISFEDIGEKVGKMLKELPKTSDEIRRMGAEERRDYDALQKQKELEGMSVDEKWSYIRSIAVKNMQLINRAYKEAKRSFSREETESFTGFRWETVQKSYGSLSITWPYQRLKLEGDGEIQRDERFDPLATLKFDYGEMLMDTDYRQSLTLQPFFAWMERKFGREVSPPLIRDISQRCGLEFSKSEQLRLMLTNGESLDFILKTLSDSQNRFLKENGHELAWFVKELYQGPVYFFNGWLGDRFVMSPLGVAFTEEGGMILSYKKDNMTDLRQGWEKEAKDGETHFTPLDLKMMRAIAYGPTLTAK